MSRVIPLSVHGAIETLVGPAIIAAPFVLGLGEAATVVGFVLGVFVLGLALQVPGPRRSIPLSAHAGFDYALALVAAVAGVAVALIADERIAGIFLVGIGVALVALTAATRFTAPRGA